MYVLILTITLMLACGLINKLFLAIEYMVSVAVLLQQVHVFLHQTLRIVIAHVQVFALNTREMFCRQSILQKQNRHLIGSFPIIFLVFFGSYPILKQCILNSIMGRGLHIFHIPVIMALFCLTTLEGFVLHHHSGHFCLKELIFNFHLNYGTEILSTIVLYLILIISILISRCCSSFLSFVHLTCTPSMSSTSSSSSISTPTYNSSPYTSSVLTSTITTFSPCTAFALNNSCC